MKVLPCIEDCAPVGTPVPTPPHVVATAPSRRSGMEIFASGQLLGICNVSSSDRSLAENGPALCPALRQATDSLRNSGCEKKLNPRKICMAVDCCRAVSPHLTDGHCARIMSAFHACQACRWRIAAIGSRSRAVKAAASGCAVRSPQTAHWPGPPRRAEPAVRPPRRSRHRPSPAHGLRSRVRR